jgi:RNA polymerase sigma factor (sigma-70 family)
LWRPLGIEIAGMLDDSKLRALMRSAQSGDKRAYAELLTAITPLLRQIIVNQRRFLQDADIEDLVQEVLLSVHAARGTYDPARPFMPWLLAIVRNRLADAARRYGRRSATKQALEQSSVTFSPEAANMQTEEIGDSKALRHAIAQLPPAQRQAIEMLKLREMSLKQASAASGASIGALKISVHRAMATLRRSLKL